MSHELLNQGDATTFDLGSALTAPTYYQILNVDPQANRLMIRESYLRLKSLYQSGGAGLYGLSADSQSDADRQTAELEEAFAVLNDEHRRVDYDRSIGLVVRTGAAANLFSTSAQPPQESWQSASSETIQTNRSTLKVIKTKAHRADNADIQERFKSLLSEADLGDGTTLARLREIVKVGESEMQERTKISLEYIRAMEANRFDRLPQVVYVKGFMRSYLKYLCVPEAEALITAFAARLEAWQQGVKQ